MSLTKKTPQEFEYKTLEWGIFKFPDLRILFKGHVLPPSMIPHTFPLRRSAFTHLPDSHVFGDGQDGQADASTDAPAGPIDKIKHPYQPPAAVSKYLEEFSAAFSEMTEVLKVRILIRVDRDQPLSPDVTLTHEEYLYSLFSGLGKTVSSIRELNVVIIQNLPAGTRKFQIHGLRAPGELNFKMEWRDSLGTFDEKGNGLEICIRDRAGHAVRDSMGDCVRYQVGGVSRDAKGRLLLDFNGHLVREFTTSSVRDSKGRMVGISWDGSLRDHYGRQLRDNKNNVLHLGERGELTDAAGHVLLSNFAATYNAKGYFERDSRQNPFMQLPGNVRKDSRGRVFVDNDHTAQVFIAANTLAHALPHSNPPTPTKPRPHILRHAKSNIAGRLGNSY
ncbi:hypothetical protein B0J12DRAFT_745339 [Macrophomina phaseolina]|uniref:Uncharacterized protein n=1 Tax=Macrophomina phaseolina TaxID=35725 RepID=A0ABQ8FVN9_9PEZI|nr:hypothetical protein B0J12DRAFT_745339 [Macrophomina phaseolina]